jgi:hypothetical protein
MEFHAKYVHQPIQQTTPGKEKARFRGPGGYHAYGTPDGLPGAANGVVGGNSPTQAVTNPTKGNALSAIARVAGAEGVVKALDNPAMGKVSDADVEKVAIQLLMREGASKNPSNPTEGARELFEKQRIEMGEKTMEMKKSAQTRSLVSKLRSTMQLVEDSELRSGRDPNEFLPWAKTAWPQSWLLEYEKFTAKDPRFAANKAEALAIFREQKMKELRSSIQGVLNQHTHDLFGGAQSKQELEKAAQEIGNKSSWHMIRTFLDNRSNDLQREQQQLTSNLTPIQLVFLRLGMKDRGQVYLPQAGIPAPKGPTK